MIYCMELVQSTAFLTAGIGTILPERALAYRKVFKLHKLVSVRAPAGVS